MEKKCGVVICTCEATLEEKVNVEKIREALLSGGVSLVESHHCLCGPEGKDCFKALREKGIDALFIGACSPRILGERFGEHQKESGFTPEECIRVNLREQCAWTAHDEHDGTRKAIWMLKRALACGGDGMNKAEEYEKKGSTAVVVLGAGTSGLIAAGMLASLGHRVSVVEKSSSTGGHISGASLPASESGSLEALRKELQAASENPMIEIMTGSQITGMTGHVGDFSLIVRKGNGLIEKKAGALLVATGFEWVKKKSIPPDMADRVLGFESLDSLLSDAEKLDSMKKLCIWLDETCDAAPFYAARALILARRLREKGKEVYLLYSHMKVAGDGGELLYRRARKSGVLFLRVMEAPKMKKGAHGIELSFVDVLTWINGRNPQIVLEADYCVVPEVPIPSAESGQLRELLKLNAGPGGFFQDDSAGLAPGDSNRPGIYFAGGCMGPKDLQMALLEGSAAASEIHCSLSHAEGSVTVQRAKVSPGLCALCLTCIRSCPHKAIDVAYMPGGFVAGAARVETAACEGCGVCVAECPARAIKLLDYDVRFLEEHVTC